MAQGYLPQSTDTKFINFIPVDMKHEDEKNCQQLNFLDMAGEKFKNVAEAGMSEFSSYQKYLENKNPKCLLHSVSMAVSPQTLEK